MAVRYATAEAVAVAWALAAPDVTADMAGETLPRNNASWSASGFITPTIVGGDSGMNYRTQSPVVTFQCFANTPNSDVPPWNKARQLAERLRVATYRRVPILLGLPYSDEKAKVNSAVVRGNPRKTFGDFGGYAVYSTDIQLFWAPIAQ
ncbi:hypothetical protein [Amycolatopsis albispora]|uniref:Uncharacterized protein n=1 Tax=Amycolatopsis albispora TaxID=1804986 RepID=A0A344LGY6_9PSEU|nr:hypothetical protein [Amycolatopsis albispora]AXB47310.1 hypothetical protein A4R43_36695 [Amycolatopsis albispora]